MTLNQLTVNIINDIYCAYKLDEYKPKYFDSDDLIEAIERQVKCKYLNISKASEKFNLTQMYDKFKQINRFIEFVRFTAHKFY